MNANQIPEAADTAIATGTGGIFIAPQAAEQGT
jgi:hypothetical protein